MMRVLSSLLTLVSAVLIAGCVSGGPQGGDVPPGETAGELDGKDMASGLLTCGGFIDCYVACGIPHLSDSTTQEEVGGILLCEQTCQQKTRPSSVAKFAAVGACVANRCLGNGECGVNADKTGFTEADGSPINLTSANPGPCVICMTDGVAGLMGNDCTNKSSTDCNPTACKAQVAACKADR
jgi:hypothetical protein